MFTNILAGRNYSRFFSEQAVYAPALSPNYVKFANGTKRPIVGAPYSRNDFNFLNPQSQLFFYPWALYSAGQAAKTEGAAQKESWITKKKSASRHACNFRQWWISVPGRKVEI